MCEESYNQTSILPNFRTLHQFRFSINYEIFYKIIDPKTIMQMIVWPLQKLKQSLPMIVSLPIYQEIFHHSPSFEF